MSTSNVQKETSREHQTSMGLNFSQFEVKSQSDIKNLVQLRLTDLLGEVGTMYVDGADLSMKEREQKVENRTDIIIELLHSVNKAGRTPTGIEHEFL